MGLGTSYNIACNIAHFDQYDHILQPIYVCSTVFSWSAVKDANVRSVCCFSRSLCRSTSAIGVCNAARSSCRCRHPMQHFLCAQLHAMLCHVSGLDYFLEFRTSTIPEAN